MSPFETKRVTKFGMPIEGWRRCPAGRTLYRDTNTPVSKMTEIWCIGRKSLSSARVGDDGESLVLDWEVFDRPFGILSERKPKAITHHEVEVVSEVVQGKEIVVPTNRLIDTKIRYKSR